MDSVKNKVTNGYFDGHNIDLSSLAERVKFEAKQETYWLVWNQMHIPMRVVFFEIIIINGVNNR